MPGLVADAVGIPPRVGKMETEAPRVLPQPAKFRSPGKALVQVLPAGRTDVERPAGVMLAATRRGDKKQNFPDAPARRQFLANDFGLSRDAAEARDRPQRDAVLHRGVLPPPPRGGGTWPEFDPRAVAIADVGP